MVEESKEIYVYVKAILDKKNSDVYVMRLDMNGEKQGLFKGDD